MKVDHILQLGLNRTRAFGSSDHGRMAESLVDQLLELLAEYLSEGDSSGAEFRSRLERLRNALLLPGDDVIRNATARSVIELCQEQFNQYRSRNLQRDKDLAEIIVLLRSALANLTGDSERFHSSILETSDRIKELVLVNDIGELRTKIAAEVSELHRAVAEKQAKDQVQFAQLSEQVSVLQHKLKLAKAEALIDGLTGIANRRNFDMVIQRWIMVHEKNEEPFTIALMDLDNFKEINDSYGHLVGDQVLISTAMELGKSIRSNDYLARYGGEEFVILSAGMRLAESEKRFAGLLLNIEKNSIACETSATGPLKLSLTASCGLAEYALGESAEDLLRRADEALYDAKREGKNRISTRRRPLLSAFYEGRRRRK